MRSFTYLRCYSMLEDGWFIFVPWPRQGNKFRPSAGAEDLILVLLMVFETWVMPLLSGGSDISQLEVSGAWRMARILRVLRTARMARLVRLMPEHLDFGFPCASRQVDDPHQGHGGGLPLRLLHLVALGLSESRGAIWGQGFSSSSPSSSASPS